VNTTLFALTALGALLHLVSYAVAVAGDDVLPRARRPLHGALANPKPTGSARRRSAWWPNCRSDRSHSRRGSIPWIRRATSTALKAAIEAAIALILEEHQDWHLLVGRTSAGWVS